jgi:hypothetical protein
VLRVDVQKLSVDTSTLKTKVPASIGDAHRVIEGDAQVYHDGQLQMVHLVTEDDLSPLLAVMKRTKFFGGFRTSGLKRHARVFGYQPRVTIRRDYCSEASLARDDPAAEVTLKHYAFAASERLKEEAPEIYRLHEKTLDARVRDDWRIKNSVFTSGIANCDSSLYYHLDTGNFPDLWSAMYVMKRDMVGGDLVIPEFDLRLKFRTGSLLLFNGQKFIHGVTEMRRMNPNAYRYTVVYYALQGLCNCLSPVEELVRIKQVKMKRERKRAGMEDDDGPTEP